MNSNIIISSLFVEIEIEIKSIAKSQVLFCTLRLCLWAPTYFSELIPCAKSYDVPKQKRLVENRLYAPV